MSAIVAFNDLNLEISEYQDTWSLSNKQVAQGFGVSKDKSIDTGEIRLFAIMRELGILMSNNEPYQKYLDLGYLDFKLRTVTLPNGETILRFTPLVTPKGQVKLAKKLIEAIKAKNAPRLVEG